MPRRVSSSPQAILGLLSIEPMSGYELRRNIRSSVGHIWSESYGQIYPSLKKLAAAGLVRSKEEAQKGKPSRRIYSITDKGRSQLQAWLAVPPQPEIPRNEMLLKLFFGSQVAPEVMAGYVERMAAERRTLLQKFTHIESQIDADGQLPEAPFWRMTLRFGQLEMEAHLRWAEETLAALRKLEKQEKDSESRRRKTDGRR